VLACTDAGRVALLVRDVGEAIAHLERAAWITETFSLLHWRPWSAAALGLAYARAGRLAAAFPLFDEARERTAASQFLFGHALRAAWRADACLLADRVGDARDIAVRALELAREHKERGHEAWVLRLLGEVAAHPATLDADRACSHYGQALDLANQLGMRPLVAHCHLGLGKLYRRTGDHAKAQEHLTTARAMYREMDMGY
jgi:tetratricopeptide (TPR) repeat protein